MMRKIYKLIIPSVISITLLSPAVAEEPLLTGDEIVKQCGFKNPGKDQISTFTVILKDKQGTTKKSIYSRFWKDYQGAKGVVDKMILFTEFPPDAKGAAFMRVAYTEDMDKNADQWIYLPVLMKTRRVTIRDPGDSFLNSDLTHADVSMRSVGADEHTLLGEKVIKGTSYYVVESTPKEHKPLYSRRVQWFNKTGNMQDCVVKRIDYYDSRGDLLKEQHLNWQQIDAAWIWDKVVVNNIQTGYQSTFQISDVSINTGLKDRVFKERTLRAGPDAIRP